MDNVKIVAGDRVKSMRIERCLDAVHGVWSLQGYSPFWLGDDGQYDMRSDACTDMRQQNFEFSEYSILQFRDLLLGWKWDNASHVSKWPIVS